MYPANYILVDTWNLPSLEERTEDCTPIFKSLLFMNGIGGVLNPEYTSHAHTLDCTTFLFQNHNIPIMSKDPHVSELMKKHDIDVAMSSSTFIALFNNHAPEYEVEWNVPFTVQHNKTKNQVIFDKALPKSSMNIKESLYMMYNKKTQEC